MSFSTLDILLGASWKDDARCLARLYAYRAEDHRFDFTPILDIIDIVIDGANITSRLPEESIFCIMHELLGGLCAMREGRLDKHIVAFAEAGWELAVQHAGDDYELSFYGTDGPRDVTIHNVRVNRDHLLGAACLATERLLADLVGLNGAFSKEGMVRSLSRQLHQLRRVQPVRGPATDVAIPDEAGPINKSTGSGRLALAYEFDSGHADFWRYQGALDADLHSLLFSGTLTLSYWGRRRLIGRDTYLFPLFEGLVDGAERFLQVLERHGGGCALLDGSGRDEAMVTVDVVDNEHVVVRIREPSGSTGRTKTTPEDLFNVVTESAQSFLGILIALNQRQLLNHRVLDLRTRLEWLRGQFFDIRRGDQYFEGVQGYLRTLPQVRGAALERDDADHQMGYPLAELRHVFLRSSWYLARNRIDFTAIEAVGDRLLVPSEGRLDCLRRASGEVDWQVECQRLVGRSDRLALVADSDRLSAVAIDDGSRRWTLETDPDAQRPLVFDVDGSGMISLVVGVNQLVTLSQATGEPVWRFGLEHGEFVGTNLAGPVIVAVADDGFAYGLQPASGELLWKVRVRGTCLLPPISHEGRVYVCADSDIGLEGVLYSIYPLTGRRVYERRAPATFSQPPLFIGSTGLFSLETPATATVAALGLEEGRTHWTIGLDNAQVDTPVLAWLPEVRGGTLVLKSDTGQVLGIDLASGSVHWRTDLLDPGDILLVNLAPKLLDGHLVVAERFVSVLDPATGARTHRFTELPEHPSFLWVDDNLRLIIGEGDDQLECFDLSGFLALVE